MSLESANTALPHPRVDHVDHAARWVSELYSHFAGGVIALDHFTLPTESLAGYNKVLYLLLKRADVLERHLSAMRFFMPDEVSWSVAAIIVTSHYQLALLESQSSTGARSVIDEEQLGNMEVYLTRVMEHIALVHEWMKPRNMELLQEAAKKAVSEMRHRLGPSTRSKRVGFSGRRMPAPSKQDTYADWPSPRLSAFLHKLSPKLFPDIPDPTAQAKKSVRSKTRIALKKPHLPISAWLSLMHRFRPRQQQQQQPQHGVEKEERRWSFASDTTCVDERSPPDVAAKSFCESPQGSPSDSAREKGETNCPPPCAKRRLSEYDPSNVNCTPPKRRRYKPSLHSHVSAFSISSSEETLVCFDDAPAVVVDYAEYSNISISPMMEPITPPKSRSSMFTPSPLDSLLEMNNLPTRPSPPAREQFLSALGVPKRPKRLGRWHIVERDGLSIVHEQTSDIELASVGRTDEVNESDNESDNDSFFTAEDGQETYDGTHNQPTLKPNPETSPNALTAPLSRPALSRKAKGKQRSRRGHSI